MQGVASEMLEELGVKEENEEEEERPGLGPQGRVEEDTWGRSEEVSGAGEMGGPRTSRLEEWGEGRIGHETVRYGESWSCGQSLVQASCQKPT